MKICASDKQNSICTNLFQQQNDITHPSQHGVNLEKIISQKNVEYSVPADLMKEKVILYIYHFLLILFAKSNHFLIQFQLNSLLNN